MRTGAVVAAAGIAVGENSFDPLKKIGSVSVAERVAATLAKAGIEKTVFVTGFNALKLEKALSASDVVTLRNDAYASGDMLGSVCVGLRYLIGKCERILVVPANIAMFTPETVRALMRADADYARPCFGGLAGHPVMLSASLAQKLLRLEQTGGLNAALRALGAEGVDVPVNDRGVLFDARQEQELGDMREYHSSSLVRPVVRLSLAKELSFFNEKYAALLSLVDDLHSVREACQGIQISYSSGWNMIKNLEEQLGCPLINRTQGGAVGAGRSELTEVGKQLLSLYDAFKAELRADTDRLYAKYFDGVLDRRIFLICPGELASDKSFLFQREERFLCSLGKLRACLLWRELADEHITKAYYAPNAFCRQTAELLSDKVCALGGDFDSRDEIDSSAPAPLLPSLRRILSEQSGNLALVVEGDIQRRLLAELFGGAYRDTELSPGSYSVLSLDGSFHIVKLGVRPAPPLGRILCTKMLNACFVDEARVNKLIHKAESTVNEAFCAGENTEGLESAVLLRDITLSDGGNSISSPVWLRRLGYDSLAETLESLSPGRRF